MRVAESDAIGEMTQRRRHATVHILRVGETAEGARLPFRRVDPPRRGKREFVFAATGRQSAAGEIEVSAKVINLREDAIVEVDDRQRLRFSQGRKRVIDTRDKPIGRCLPEQRPPVGLGLAPRQRSAISLKRFKPASRVLLEVPEKQSEIDDVAAGGRKRQTARCERDGLIGPDSDACALDATT